MLTTLYVTADVELTVRVEEMSEPHRDRMRRLTVVGPELARGCIAREAPEEASGHAGLSPLSPVTLDDAARREAGIPGSAATFGFMYPLGCLAGKHARLVREYAVHVSSAQERGWLDALLFGAFCYFDESDSVVQVNALCLTPTPNAKQVHLEGPRAATHDAFAALTQLGRVQPVTLRHLIDVGLHRFAWVNPEEAPGGHALSPDRREGGWPHGAFVYAARTPKHADDSTVVFRVVPDGSPGLGGGEASASVSGNGGGTAPALHREGSARSGGAFRGALDGMLGVLAEAASEQAQLAAELAVFRRSLLERWLRRHALPVALYYLSGCAAYALLEGWSVLDSLYFLTATGTAIGYGDLAPISTAGRALASVYALVGCVIIVGASLTVVEPGTAPRSASEHSRSTRERAHRPEAPRVAVRQSRLPIRSLVLPPVPPSLCRLRGGACVRVRADCSAGHSEDACVRSHPGALHAIRGLLVRTRARRVRRHPPRAHPQHRRPRRRRRVVRPPPTLPVVCRLDLGLPSWGDCARPPSAVRAAPLLDATHDGPCTSAPPGGSQTSERRRAAQAALPTPPDRAPSAPSRPRASPPLPTARLPPPPDRAPPRPLPTARLLPTGRLARVYAGESAGCLGRTA